MRLLYMRRVCPGSNSEMCKPDEEEEFDQSSHRFFPFAFTDLQNKYMQRGMIDKMHAINSRDYPPVDSTVGHDFIPHVLLPHSG